MIDLFNRGPYTDLHQLNLDWILEVLRDHETRIKELEDKINELKGGTTA